MVRMFRNIAFNLKAGGWFVGMTPHPSEDPRGQVEKALCARAPCGGVKVTVKRDVDDGVETHLVAKTEAGIVEFDSICLRKSVYEESARLAMLKGTLEWRHVIIPEDLEHKFKGGSDRSWDTYLRFSYFGVLVVGK